MRKWIALSGLAVIAVLVAIQFVPVTTANPPVESDIPTSLDVKVVLRRACYDCHSHGLCCKNWLEGEERLSSSRYAANPNSWLMTWFWARMSAWQSPRSGLCGACAWRHNLGWSAVPWQTPQTPVQSSRGVSHTDDPVR
jgi:Haem-binding domain